MFSSGTILSTNGFSINTPIGVKTLYAQQTGWASSGATTADMSTAFGLWTAYSNGGTCGGANIVAPDKICPSLAPISTNNHFDTTSVKSLYIKASN